MKQVLIVDDEKKFLLSLTQGLANRLTNVVVLTAHDGFEALDVLAANSVDLLITDLKMPKMDGFALLARIKDLYPHLPVIVMTAFGTPEIEAQLQDWGSVQYLEKPTDLESMTEKIKANLSAGAKGFIEGITLPTFAQLIELEKKTCSLHVIAGDRSGDLFFIDGQLADARNGKTGGEAAAFDIFSWDEVEIKMSPGKRKLERQVHLPLHQILLESMRQMDERSRDEQNRKPERPSTEQGTQSSPSVTIAPTDSDHKSTEQHLTQHEEEMSMSIQEKLKEFQSIDGFGGVGIFTPGGESLAIMTGDMKGNMKELGILANNMLLNAQKAAVEMGVGTARLVHVETETAHILARCLNEGNDPVKTEPGKAHIHLVITLNNDNGIGMAKLKMEKLIKAMAEDFRM